MDRLNAVASVFEPAREDPRFMADPADPADRSGLAAQQPSPRERLARIVRTIEADIIPRLVRAHTADGELLPLLAAVPVDAQALRAEVPGFAQMLLAPGESDWAAVIEGHLNQGVAFESLCLDLLGPAAVELGELWNDDRCSFSDVTMGTGRLQRALRVLGSTLGPAQEAPLSGRRILLMPAPGEQHTFGLSMVAEFFRRAGWEVAGPGDLSSDDAASLARTEWFDAVGISVGAQGHLDGLRSAIDVLRRVSRNRALAVLLGGPSFVGHPQLALDLGAHGSADDGAQAVQLASQLVEHLGVDA